MKKRVALGKEVFRGMRQENSDCELKLLFVPKSSQFNKQQFTAIFTKASNTNSLKYSRRQPITSSSLRNCKGQLEPSFGGATL